MNINPKSRFTWAPWPGKIEEHQPQVPVRLGPLACNQPFSLAHFRRRAAPGPPFETTGSSQDTHLRRRGAPRMLLDITGIIPGHFWAHRKIIIMVISWPRETSMSMGSRTRRNTGQSMHISIHMERFTGVLVFLVPGSDHHENPRKRGQNDPQPDKYDKGMVWPEGRP